MQPNQFTKAEEEGKPKPPGSNQFTTGKRDKLDQATKDKIRAEKAATKLEAVLDDPESTIEQIIAAAKNLLPYGKSTLASVQSMQLNENATKSEEEIREELRALFLAKPELLQALNLAWKPDLAVSNEQQSTAASPKAA